MGYLSNIVSDARRNYRVDSRQADFSQAGRTVPKTFEAAGVEADAAPAAVYDNSSLGRAAPSQGEKPGEPQQPETYASRFPARPDEVSTKAMHSVTGKDSVRRDVKASFSTPSHERGKSKADGKSNRMPRQGGVSQETPQGRRVSPSSDIQMNGREKNPVQRKNISSEMLPLTGGDAKPLSANEDAGLKAEGSALRKEALQGEAQSAPAVGAGVKECEQDQDVPEHGAPASFKHAPQGETEDVFITRDEKDEGARAQLNAQFDRQSPETRLSSKNQLDREEAFQDTAAIGETLDFVVPGSRDEPAGEVERAESSPQVVIGSIEVIVEAAPTAQNSCPVSQFSRDPGRYYLRRL